MKCKKCGRDLSAQGSVSIEAEQAAHDGSYLDITVTCNGCGARHYDFVDLRHFVLEEEE